MCAHVYKNAAAMSEHDTVITVLVFVQELVWNPYFVDIEFMMKIISRRKPRVVVLGIGAVSITM